MLRRLLRKKPNIEIKNSQIREIKDDLKEEVRNLLFPFLPKKFFKQPAFWLSCATVAATVVIAWTNFKYWKTTEDTLHQIQRQADLSDRTLTQIQRQAKTTENTYVQIKRQTDLFANYYKKETLTYVYIDSAIIKTFGTGDESYYQMNYKIKNVGNTVAKDVVIQRGF